MKRLLQNNLCWRVGSRENIFIRDDTWILGLSCHKIKEGISNTNFMHVADLIDNHKREWNLDMIKGTFFEVFFTRILQIPLVNKDDFMV